ncbi:hypothetical protein [Terrabacter carboxydivorans]|uniref:Transposase n=1 Tax=Terrabacter carboxydivorans TaxID=619730 RepID=A0ABP5YZ62_9MICO
MTDGSPGAGAADPAILRALTTGRSTTRTMSDELLTHLPDLGDLPTQRALDAWVEQAADTLRALSEALEERLLELGSARSLPPAVDDQSSSATTGSASRRGDAW